jgi:hypothetical protein
MRIHAAKGTKYSRLLARWLVISHLHGGNLWVVDAPQLGDLGKLYPCPAREGPLASAT